jgi:hypothetical protein
VVFSCRHLDYSVTLSSKDFPVPQVRIEPLTDTQVQEFLTLYSSEHGATLWQNLQFMTDLMAQNLALAGRCAAQPEVALSDTLKDKVRWSLVERTQDPGADLRARIAAGLALGELGDPRFVRQPGP